MTKRGRKHCRLRGRRRRWRGGRGRGRRRRLQPAHTMKWTVHFRQTGVKLPNGFTFHNIDALHTYTHSQYRRYVSATIYTYIHTYICTYIHYTIQVQYVGNKGPILLTHSGDFSSHSKQKFNSSKDKSTVPIPVVRNTCEGTTDNNRLLKQLKIRDFTCTC